MDEKLEGIEITRKVDDAGRVLYDKDTFPTTGMKVFGWIMVHRPMVVLLSILGSLVGYMLVTVNNGIDVDGAVLIMGLISVMFTAGATNMVNEGMDKEIDAINKPYRPCPSGLVNVNVVFKVAILEFIIATILAYLVGFKFLLFVFFMIVMTTHYNIWGKRQPYIGSIETPLGACLIPYSGGAIFGNFNQLIPLCIFIFIFETGREIMIYLEDVDADGLEGVTIAHLYPRSTLSAVAFTLYLLSLVFVLHPWFWSHYSMFFFWGSLIFIILLISIWVISNHRGDTEEAIHLWHRNVARGLLVMYQIVLVTEAFIS